MDIFETTIKIAAYGADKVYGQDFYVEDQNVMIKWGLELEMRSWGVKSLSVTIPDQKIYITVTEAHEDEDVETVKEIELKNVAIEMDDAKIIYGLSPQGMDLDLTNGKALIEF